MLEIDERMLIEAINKLASTQDGQIVLACLKEFCHFDSDIIALDPVDTQANANCRRAYLYLRKYIHTDHLKKIEFDYTRKAKDNGRDNKHRASPSDKHDERKLLSAGGIRKQNVGSGNLTKRKP